MSVIYKYVGNGGYISGVPARDLTAVDLSQFTTSQKQAVKTSGLYAEIPQGEARIPQPVATPRRKKEKTNGE